MGIKAAKKTAGKIAKSASAKKNALAMKKSRERHLRQEDLEPCFGGHLRCEVASSHGGDEKIWVYIKSHKLNEGRTIKPDAALKAVFPVSSIDMLKMAGYVSKHLS